LQLWKLPLLLLKGEKVQGVTDGLVSYRTTGIENKISVS
jgi:hypothetical protein